MNKLIKPILVAGLTAAMLTACSGSGSDPVASSGRISGFGSIIVNGVHYSVNGSTTINIDGTTQTITSDDQLPNFLAEGMVVEVDGRRNDDGITGKVDDIFVEAELEGAVDSADTDPVTGTNTFVMVERTVMVTADTVFAAGVGPLSAITIGDRLEVDGYLQSNGAVLATYIKADDGEALDEFKGIIESVGVNQFKLTGMINSVTYDGSTTFEGGVAADLEAGRLVEVHTTTQNSLVAARIEFEDDEIADGLETEIEGLISNETGCDNATGNFTVNLTCVSTDDSTIYLNGAVDDIAANVLVEVDGVMVNGVLVADKVKFQGNRIEAEVTFANVANSSGLQLFGTIAVNIVPGVTEIETDDFSGTTVTDIINTGSDIEVRGFKVGATSMTATRIRAESVSEEELRGPVTSVTPNTTLVDNQLVILGVTIKPVGSIELSIEDVVYCVSCSASQVETFFTDEIKVNGVVEAEGSFGGGVFTADKIEIQLPDDDL